MTVQEAIARRRSIRRFTQDPVAREELLELLEAARLSPSSINAQPWRFRLVTDRETIAWLSGPPTSKQRWLANAPAVIVCCVDQEAYLKDAKANLHALRDAGMVDDEFHQEVMTKYLGPVEAMPLLVRGAAVMNLAIALSAMLLRAVELGLGATWVGRVDDAEVRDRLGIPDRYYVAALLAVGHPGEDPEPRPRKSLQDLLV